MSSIFQRSFMQVMSGATTTKRGMTGGVPTPAAGDQFMFLRGDGQWAAMPTAETAIGSDDLSLPFDPITAFENAIG